MKMIKISALCLGVMLVLTSAAYVDHHPSNKRDLVNVDPGKGFAVLELFTSEGCSSCPPAEELLERIQKEAGDKPVYVLAYHVDYWNRLGWKDVFSNAAFSTRQYWYHNTFTSQVYTPQLILNGKSEFVGSDEVEISNAIVAALKGSEVTKLALNAVRSDKTINIRYQVTGRPVNSQLLLALVQKHAVSQVKAGENEGRTLSHAQIVRQLSTFSMQFDKGTEEIMLPAGVSPDNWEIIGFVQNPGTGEISAAARTTI